METRSTAIPAILLGILFFTIEISFTYSLFVNLYLFFLVSFYLVVNRKIRWLLVLALFPFLPAMTTFWSVWLNGSGPADAWLLFARTYAFAALGIGFIVAVDLEECFLLFEHYHVPPTFIYGILVVVHAVPEIRREVRSIYEASLLRGKRLYPWSAYYYMKTIFLALSWRDIYTEAMYSKGFTEQGFREHYQNWKVSKSAILLSVVLILFGNSLMIMEGLIK